MSAVGSSLRGGLRDRFARTLVSVSLVGLAVPETVYAQRHRAPVEETTRAEGEARERHAAGVQMLRLIPPQPNLALAELQRAWELRRGGPLEYLEMLHIARSHQFLGQYSDAIDWYLRYLRAAPPSAREATQYEPSGHDVKESIRIMLRTLCWLDIETNVPSAEVWDGNRPVGHAPGHVLVETGRRSIELRAEGHLPMRQYVSAYARGHHPLTFILPRSGIDGLRPIFFYVTAGVTAATLLTGGILGSVALARSNDRNEALGARATDADFIGIRSLAVVADVTLAVGVVGTIASAILAARTEWRPRNDRPTGARAMLAPGSVRGGVGLQLVGTF